MKKAFTMLELIMVIVIVGILAAVIMPRTGSNDTAEAAVKLLSDIRYTQHLAMIDDKYDATNATWHQELWQIRFNDAADTYSVMSNGIPARNPMENNGSISNVDLGVQINPGPNCSEVIGNNDFISFDHMGRPMVGDLNGTTAYSNLMTTNPCVITLDGTAADVNITIVPETGYARIN